MHDSAEGSAAVKAYPVLPAYKPGVQIWPLRAVDKLNRPQSHYSDILVHFICQKNSEKSRSGTQDNHKGMGNYYLCNWCILQDIQFPSKAFHLQMYTDINASHAHVTWTCYPSTCFTSSLNMKGCIKVSAYILQKFYRSHGAPVSPLCEKVYLVRNV